MALADITKEAVDSAILEYDQLGADAFLAQYGFAPAKRYWLELNGKRYPSKAIAGVAHKYIDGSQLLPSASFTGGEAFVGRKLRKLGFVIEAPERNPPWSRDELILALDLYFTNPANPPQQRCCRAISDPEQASPSKRCQRRSYASQRERRLFEDDEPAFVGPSVHRPR